jgi:hypothetical protein
MSPRLLTVLVLLLPALLASPRTLAAATMTVSDVQVDVTSKSAAAARDEAIATAQRDAFARLVTRLVPDAAEQAKIKPAQADIERLVQDFAIESERVSPVRYIGVFSVRFRAGRVRAYLADAGVHAVGDQQEVTVLPVYRSAKGTLLWEPSNPWRTAWERGGYGDGPVTLTLPNGDPFDTGTLSADAAVNGDMTAIGALIQRYHTSGLVVAVAEPRDPAAGPVSGLAITATIYDATGVKGTQTVTVDPQPGGVPENNLRRGVSAIADALETGWRQSGSTGLVGTIVANDGQADSQADDQSQQTPGTLYPIAISLAGISDWISVRDRLATVPGVQQVALDVLTREGAAFTVSFAGDTLALQAAIAATGFALVQTAPADAAGPGAFRLRPADAVPPPAPEAAATPVPQATAVPTPQPAPAPPAGVPAPTPGAASPPPPQAASPSPPQAASPP